MYMLHLSDGRDHGYMWDTGRKLKCDAGLRDGTTVFFMLPGRYDPIPMAVENGTVPVPDEAWHKEGKFIVFLYAMDSTGRYTRTSRTFTVKYAPKPNNYAYTPTEVLDWHTLEKRLEDLEGEGLANAVAEYLKENPVEAGATAEEAAQIEQNKTDIATLDRIKLSASELPTAVNEALAQAKASGEFDGKDGADGQPGADGKDYVLTEADKQEIAEQAAGMVEPSAPDLTGYATEEFVNETAETLRGEIPVKQIEYLKDIPEYISTHPYILVSNTTNNPTSTNWTGTLLITRGYSNYGVYDFSAMDGAGACYQGAVSLRDNSINLNLVDSLESKATKEYVDEAVGNVNIPTTLPNPKALTFTGAATGTYDGSAALTVNIPEGGGGTGGGSAEWELLTDITLTEASTIAEVKYDTKYKTMYAHLVIPKVAEKISVGGSLRLLHGYGVYYASIGDTNYPYVIELICHKNDGNLLEFYCARPTSGVGNYSNWQQRNSLLLPNQYSPFSIKCTLELPAGTVLKVLGRE
jgi:hypothetical protein